MNISWILRNPLRIIPFLFFIIGVEATVAKTQKDKFIDVTLYVNGIRGAETWIIQESPSQFQCPEPIILLALSKVLPTDRLRNLERNLIAGGLISNTFLSQFGVNTRFDPKTKRLLLEIGPGYSNTANVETHAVETPFDGKPPSESLPDSTPLQSNSIMDTKTVEKIPEKKLSDSTIPTPLPSHSIMDTKTVERIQETKNLAPELPKKMVAETSLVAPTISRDDLYRKIFKTSAPRLPEMLEVDLRVDGLNKGKIWVQILDNGKSYKVNSSELNGFLTEDLLPEVLEKIHSASDPKGRISGEKLNQLGLPSTLIISRFLLQFDLPNTLMQTRTHYLSRQNNMRDTTGMLRPGRLSAFININARQQFRYSQIKSNTLDTLSLIRDQVRNENRRNRQLLFARLNGALNIQGLVLEGDGSIQEQEILDSSYFDRGNLRILYDDSRHALRYTLGDLLFRTIGYQNFLTLGGVGIQREFALQPNNIAYPTKEYEFFLAEASEVKVFVNGNQVTILNLKPGHHNLKNFPLITGESKVRIEILDASGRQQEVNFDFIYAPNLLRQGLSHFSLHTGFPSKSHQERMFFNAKQGELNVLGYEYQYKRPFFALNYLHGITSQWTAGGYAQSLARDVLLGLEGLHALRRGNLVGDLAVSHFDSTQQQGQAIKLSYAHIPFSQEKNKNLSWVAQVEYRSRFFSEIGLPPNLRKILGINVSASNTLDIANVSFGAGYQFNREEPNSYNLNGSLNKRWESGLIGSVAFNHYLNEKAFSNSTLTIAFQYSFSAKKNSFLASQRSTNTTQSSTLSNKQPWENYTDLLWDYNSSSPFPSNPSGFLNASISPFTSDYTGRLAFHGNQGILEGNIRRNEPGTKEQGNISRNYLDLTAKSSLVMVDGKFAMARTVENSFVIVDGVKNLEDTKLELNSHSEGYDARTNFMGPSVLTNLSPFSPRTIDVKPINPPMGAQLKRSNYLIYPAYKSGTRISLGSEAIIMVMGTLKNEEQISLEYQSLRLVPLGKTIGSASNSFTNLSGRFQAGPLAYGKWRIEAEGGHIYEFEIPVTAKGLLQLGDLKPLPTP